MAAGDSETSTQLKVFALDPNSDKPKVSPRDRMPPGLERPAFGITPPGPRKLTPLQEQMKSLGV